LSLHQATQQPQQPLQSSNQPSSLPVFQSSITLFNMLFTKVLYLAVAFIPYGVSALKAGDIIPDSYIVVLKDTVSTSELSSHKSWAQSVHSNAVAKRDVKAKGIKHSYNFGKLKGYAGNFDKDTIATISTRPEVAYVEADRVVELDAIVTQTNVPSWGLARLSSATTGATSYKYDSTAGSGVTVYIVDTGILPTHTDFGGRAATGANYITGESAVDGNGHGTHVAGTIGGTTYGVAKKVNLIGVKVLSASGSGSNSGVISGIQWVVSDAQSKGITKRAVANMSLGGTYSSAVNNAVSAAVTAGITFCVAAGNDGANASGYSPASTPSAITVGATTSTDAKASYSNYGAVLDVFAPGSSITSSWIGGTTAKNTISGTSMASPHIAGLAAYLIGLEGLSSPTAVANRITALALSGKVTSAGSGSPNRLANNGAA
jgi:oryzin